MLQEIARIDRIKLQKNVAEQTSYSTSSEQTMPRAVFDLEGYVQVLKDIYLYCTAKPRD